MTLGLLGDDDRRVAEQFKVRDCVDVHEAQSVGIDPRPLLGLDPADIELIEDSPDASLTSVDCVGDHWSDGSVITGDQRLGATVVRHRNHCLVAIEQVEDQIQDRMV